MKKTKIICTMGPGSNDKEVMRALIKSGMDIARFNFSHGSHEEHKGRMDQLKELREQEKKPIAILLDTKGPEIRTGQLKDGKKVMLKEGNAFTLSIEEKIGDETGVSITYAGLIDDVVVGSIILIDDGLIELKVTGKTDKEIKCIVDNGGELGEKKGVNVPGVAIRLPAITEKDKEDIRFGVEQDIDFILGGNAVGGGGNMTRLAALTAGIDREVPAVTLDLQCGSALEAVTQAAAKIESGLAELVLAGGLESSSTQPLRMWNPNHPDYEKDKVWTVARFAPGQHGEQIMLEGAERTAISEHVTKEEQDFWVLESHHRAAKAAQEGLLSDIQVSVAGSCKDEGIRASMSRKLMDRLPYLLPGGCVINAANACLMHDGAAFVNRS